MSIQVTDLRKTYGAQEALRGISFSATPGRVLGFLGPNGAGKSTTMKILSGSVAPTAGQASICGIDIRESPLEARRLVGYLPEHNPLYLDLYVHEMLRFTAGLHQLPKANARIDDVINATGLAPEQHKKIKELSKGYRQRVGLAAAMLHDPDVLILDEPTAGLDPNQLQGIRTLIRSLGREKTILLSTHIMQEVEAVCDDVVIIHHGGIVADFRLAELAERHPEGDLESLFIRLTANQ